jgi:hypothetical protein
MPSQYPHLIVERLDLARLHDMGVVAQAVEELGAIGLAVDRLRLVVLDEDVTFGPFGTGCSSAPDVPSQTPAMGPERPQVGQRVGFALGLGVDVLQS